MPADSIIPDIPGELLTDPNIQHHLSSRVASLCGLSSNKFPGSQPVSFTTASLDLLEREDFWVCEKSDGVRVLVFIVMNNMTNQQEVWLIDRKERYFNVTGLYFTHWEHKNVPLKETLIDGELVLDIDPRTGHQTLRYYAFDCMVLNEENIMEKPLDKRYARLRNWVVTPLEASLKAHPEMRQHLPFEVVAKREELSYHLRFVMKEHIPSLQHGHDGLIFTCVQTPYIPGTDENILKWKPPSENTIDFKLELRFPPLLNADEPDYHAKPEFLLCAWQGRDDYEFFDFMYMSDEEWQKVKETGEQLDDRIVEVFWDSRVQIWRMLRMRNDKPHGNHRSIVDKILHSISDGVEIEEIYARADNFKAAWKARARQRAHPPSNVQRQVSQQYTTGGHQEYSRNYSGPAPGGGHGDGYAHGGPGGGIAVVSGLKR
ncbi:uncharacterized protein L203_100317 [Cryptococcus depauperatus CBS 7841]|uniref:mRNA-capping enzyme subunit alpha n=1 Tax=Cryptococcus depauperatus CBS 7841 TaxID=1295531 RepID=A0A1E3IZ36_9TREE|nr:mRNA guanylyltransferase [Cryptococcus depauperatus CBS 7841]